MEDSTLHHEERFDGRNVNYSAYKKKGRFRYDKIFQWQIRLCTVKSARATPNKHAKVRGGSLPERAGQIEAA